MKLIPAAWAIGLNPADKESFHKALLGSNIVVDRLKEILNEKQQSVYDDMIADENFDKPEWAIRHASHLGKLQTLSEILRLFDFPDAPDHGAESFK